MWHTHGRRKISILWRENKMGCLHKKECDFHHWCNVCAEIVAGPKPKCKWKHGDYASRDWDEDSPFKVLNSEMNLVGIATETPKWDEYLIFRDGGGTASLFKKMKMVKA